MTLGTSNQFILMGEEPYYIDKLSDFIEEKRPKKKGFNQTFYTAETFQ
jgi:hypothetical protein